MLNLRPPLAPAHRLFGAVATYRPVSGLHITVSALHLRGATPPAVGALGMSAPGLVDIREEISLLRTEVPVAPPIGSEIEADFGAGLRSYRVDRVDAQTPDEWRLVVS